MKKEKFRKKVGRIIKEYREKHNLSYSELAEKIGISKSHVYDLEHGDKDNPTIETISKLADALEVSPVEFFVDDWYDMLPPELQEYVRKENIDYLEVGLKVKEKGYRPEIVKEAIEVIEKGRRFKIE